MGVSCCTQPIKVYDQLEVANPKQVIVARHSKEEEYIQQEPEVIQQLPILGNNVKKILQQKKPFSKQIQQNLPNFKVKRYTNGQTFHGQFDAHEKPDGLGKLYKADGSLIIGYFKGGVLNGPAFYAEQSELYCEGDVINGTLNCRKGILHTPKFKYLGGFKDNIFDGEGTEITNQSKFQGHYVKGKKVKGIIIWKTGENNYSYEGTFNEHQQFQGNGRLVQPFGVYVGSFANGQKNGNGKYEYSSGLVYEGSYVHGKKEGKGKLINKDGTLSYWGQFANGFPHGIGKSYKNNEVAQQGKYVQGIFQESI